ncbi:MAG: hypothetical protein RL563_2403 [Pseudomonadota bacterium]
MPGAVSGSFLATGGVTFFAAGLVGALVFLETTGLAVAEGRSGSLKELQPDAKKTTGKARINTFFFINGEITELKEFDFVIVCHFYVTRQSQGFINTFALEDGIEHNLFRLHRVSTTNIGL